MFTLIYSDSELLSADDEVNSILKSDAIMPFCKEDE